MLPPVQLMGTGMRVVSSNNKFTEASFQITDQPLDLAIDGRGFLQVLQPDGTLAYTRNGQLQINGQGELVTNNGLDRKSTRLNSSHVAISYAVFCLKKKKRRN